MEEDAAVYKLIGPALIKQDVTEAKANVDKRIEYITAEMTRSEKSVKALQKQLGLAPIEWARSSRTKSATRS